MVPYKVLVFSLFADGAANCVGVENGKSATFQVICSLDSGEWDELIVIIYCKSIM